MKITTNRPYYAEDLGIDDPDGALRGVFVGGCIDERTAWSIWEDAWAHAHSSTKDSWMGWLCIVRPKDVLTPRGVPTKILLHEYAHLLVPNQGHTRTWKRAVTRLGAGSEIQHCKFTPLK